MTDVLTSHQLVERYELHGPDLSRWRERRWVRPEKVRRGNTGDGNQGSLWPDWTDRMVRLLLADRHSEVRGHGNEEARHRRNGMMEAVADALAEDPEVGWVVFVDGTEPVPCRHGHEVAAVLGGTVLWATIVAIPLSVTLDGTSVLA